MVGVSARAIRIGVLDNDPFALDAMCAMISAVSKDFRVMWSTGSPAVFAKPVSRDADVS